VSRGEAWTWRARTFLAAALVGLAMVAACGGADTLESEPA
jgi:hypothetical protein